MVIFSDYLRTTPAHPTLPHDPGWYRDVGGWVQCGLGRVQEWTSASSIRCHVYYYNYHQHKGQTQASIKTFRPLYFSVNRSWRVHDPLYLSPSK